MRTDLKLCAVALAMAAAVGCRQDMQDQPKFIPLRPSEFFADGRSERPLVEGTVARGHLNDDAAFYTGKGPDGRFIETFPFPVTRGGDRARPATLQYILRSLSRPAG